MASSHKQNMENAAIAADGLTIARLSLAVAFAAFLVSIIGLVVKRKNENA